MKNVLITEVSEKFSLIIQNSETHALAFPNIHSSVRYQKKVFTEAMDVKMKLYL